MINFFIGAWLTISPMIGQTDTSSVVLVEWWYQTDYSIASNLNSYTITDSVKEYKIYSIYPVYEVPEGIPKNTYLFALVTEKIPIRTWMYCTAENYGTDYFWDYGINWTTNTLHMFVGGWLTSTPLNNMIVTPSSDEWENSDTTSVFLMEFSHSMDTTNLTNKNNYSIIDYETGAPLNILKIGIVKQLEDIIVSNNKLIAVMTSKAQYKKTYMMVVTSVKDIAGNYILDHNSDIYYFNGLRPSFGMPQVDLTK